MAEPHTSAPGLAVSIRTTRIGLTDLIREALASLAERPRRTILNSIGTVIGVGAFVAVLGLTTTAAGQVSSVFSTTKATQVVIDDAGATSTSSTVYSFPREADRIVESLNGVIAAGRTWPLPGGEIAIEPSLDPGVRAVKSSVHAASPGYLRALEPTLQSGVLLNDFHEAHAEHVAMLGRGAAQALGITSLLESPTIYIRGSGYTVIGILGDARRDAGALNRVFIPASTALEAYGEPDDHSPAKMLLRTRVGSAVQAAREAPLVLRPDRPALMRATPPPEVFTIESHVSEALSSAFLTLAIVVLAISGIGIANTTLVAVFERLPEFGLRRSLGARPVDIANQVLAETAILGTIGGLLGASIGVTVTLAVAVAQSWTAILDPVVTVMAPLLGTLVGGAAGLLPAVRAARVQPVVALRR